MSLSLPHLISRLYTLEEEPFFDPAAIANNLVANAIWVIGSFLVGVLALVVTKRSAHVRNALFPIRVAWLRMWHWLWVTRASDNVALQPFVAPTRESKPEVVAQTVPTAQPAQIASPAFLPSTPEPGWSTSSSTSVHPSAADLKGTSSAPPRFKMVYVKKGESPLNERGYLLRLVNYGDGDAQDVRLDPRDASPTGSNYWQLVPAHSHVDFQLEPHDYQYRFPTFFEVSYTESSGKKIRARELVLPPEDAPDS